MPEYACCVYMRSSCFEEPGREYGPGLTEEFGKAAGLGSDVVETNEARDYTPIRAAPAVG